MPNLSINFQEYEAEKVVLKLAQDRIETLRQKKFITGAGYHYYEQALKKLEDRLYDKL